MRRILMISLLSAFVLQWTFAAGENTRKAYWLIYEQGRAAMQKGEYGEALQLFKEAILAAGILPEAEMSIGDVYMAEGEYDLAKREYEKSYNQRNAFDIPETKYEVQYRLSKLYEQQELYKLMEDRLLAIVADDRRWVETASQRLRSQVERNYFEEGMDRVLVLYRFEDSFAATAHAKLGWFYYRTGLSAKAVSHLLFALIPAASQMVAWLQERDADIQFSSLEALMAVAATKEELRSYIAESDLFKTIYYLANATFAAGYPAQAASLWNAAAGSSLSGSYRDLARKQLKAPFSEPLLMEGKTPKNR
jgi:tetratricopeptide (TPR) repeat protein